MKKVICVHGIGDAKNNFYEEWEAILRKNHPDKEFEVSGLYWEDISDEWLSTIDANPIPKRLSKILNLGWLSNFLSSNELKTFSDFFFDFAGLAYSDAYRDDLIKKVRKRLEDLYEDEDTILIAHSLGAAILPQVLMYEKSVNEEIDNFSGVILMASPLGIRTPLPSKTKDMLDILCYYTYGKYPSNEKKRLATLKSFAGILRYAANRKLTFLINPQDIVCSDPKFEINLDNVLDKGMQEILKLLPGLIPNFDLNDIANEELNNLSISLSNELDKFDLEKISEEELLNLSNEIKKLNSKFDFSDEVDEYSEAILNKLNKEISNIDLQEVIDKNKDKASELISKILINMNSEDLSNEVQKKLAEELVNILKKCKTSFEVDIIPQIKQGFNSEEQKAITDYKGNIKFISNAGIMIEDVVKNHAVEHYLNSKEFIDSFNNCFEK